MTFVVITSAEAYDTIVESGEMPGLLTLGAEIVLVRPLYDELARDPATAAFIAAHSPPFTVRFMHPASRVHTAVSDWMRDIGRPRLAGGEAGVIVMVDAGDWLASDRKPNRVLAIACEGLVDRIRGHLKVVAAISILAKAPDVPPDPGDEMPD